MAVSMSDRKLSPETRAAHACFGFDAATGAVVPPLHAATTYVRDSNYSLRDPTANYARNGTPNTALAERVIAKGYADNSYAAMIELFADPRP